MGLRAQKHRRDRPARPDADELELPFTGLTWFERREPGPRAVACSSTLPTRAAIKKSWRRSLRRCAAASARDVEYHLVPTSRSPESVLWIFCAAQLRGKVRR